MTKQTEFIASIAPGAQQAQRDTGVYASVSIAQAVLESGWGKSAPGNNLFGIKADKSWKGAFKSFFTDEFEGGKKMRKEQRFRAYTTRADSIKDHADFLLRNPRYAGAFKTRTGLDFATAIAAAGYATDPDYAAKLSQLITDYKLMEYDNAKTT